jgi:hypothetical protein
VALPPRHHRPAWAQGEVRLRRRLPTDRMILETIYDRHSRQYEAVSRGDDTQSSDNRIYIPVDLAAVAAELGADGNIVFGRLLHYLDRKHAYRNEQDGSWTYLLWLRFDRPEGRHWINFPLMASVLAGLQEDHRRVLWTRNLAIAAFVVSVAGLLVSFANTLWSTKVVPQVVAPTPTPGPKSGK